MRGRGNKRERKGGKGEGVNRREWGAERGSEREGKTVNGNG